jgi:hypothetical protein
MITFKSGINECAFKKLGELRTECKLFFTVRKMSYINNNFLVKKVLHSFIIHRRESVLCSIDGFSFILFFLFILGAAVR